MTGLMKKIPFAIDTFKALVGAITFQDVADDGRTGHAESVIQGQNRARYGPSRCPRVRPGCRGEQPDLRCSRNANRCEGMARLLMNFFDAAGQYVSSAGRFSR